MYEYVFWLLGWLSILPSLLNTSESFVPVLHALYCYFPFLLLLIYMKEGLVNCLSFNSHYLYETMCFIFQWEIRVVRGNLQEFLLKKIQKYFCKESSIDLSIYLSIYVCPYVCLYTCMYSSIISIIYYINYIYVSSIYLSIINYLMIW